jgi:hypothetical protein
VVKTRKFQNMKKIILIGIAIGTLNLAQATSITILSAGSVISGPYSYLYNESVSPLTAGSTISGATLSFSDIELTASGPANIPNTLFYDLINGDFATKTISSGETKTDFFQNNSPYKGISDALGSQTLSLYNTVTWTYTFTGQALTDLQNDIANGVFDIGLDPNCTYDIKGSVCLNYTVTPPPTGKNVSAPDATTTAGLLGISFLSLIGLRRKFAV